ncbi:hypothetical protein CGZ69_34085 [Streptomyces peucetius subsp. caesius ATCC 27952]|nr:hypothetical protein CGZ69_34085 [Streptomyces peucetius subsp. caesius ATCC 27952]
MCAGRVLVGTGPNPVLTAEPGPDADEWHQRLYGRAVSGKRRNARFGGAKRGVGAPVGGLPRVGAVSHRAT